MIFFVLSVAAAFAADPEPAPPVAPAPAAEPGPPPPDRSHPPDITPPVLRDLPEPDVHAVGAARVHHLEVEGIRKVAIRISLGRGSSDLAGKPDEVSQALADLFGTASKEHLAAEVGALEDLDQIDVDCSIGPTSGTVWVTAPKDQLATAFSLVHEFLAEAKFPGGDVKRWIDDRTLWLTTTGATSQSEVADEALTYGWYPADSAWGARPDEVAARAMKAKDVVDRLHGWTASAPIDALVVGDVPWSTVEPLAKAAFEGIGASGARNPDPPYRSLEHTRVIAVDMPGQAQAAIRLRTTAPLRDDPDRVNAWTLAWALGGNFFSRLNANLRESNGFTYGADASYLDEQTRGAFTVSVDVPANRFAASIVEIDAELQRVVDAGITPEEVTSAYRASASAWNSALANAGNAADFYLRPMVFGEPIAAVRARVEAVPAVTPEATARIAARYFGADTPRLWVVVGDRTVLEGQLASLGWTPEWVPPQRAFLGEF